MATRFRGFLPVVIDVETGGFNSASDALLEIAAVTVGFTEDGSLDLMESISYHVTPFEGANVEPASLEVNGIDPYHPLQRNRQQRRECDHGNERQREPENRTAGAFHRTSSPESCQTQR